MDDQAVRALLAQGESDTSRGIRFAIAFWVIAGGALTGIAFYVGAQVGRADTAGAEFARTLALGTAAAFGLIALYCWWRLFKVGSR